MGSVSPDRVFRQAFIHSRHGAVGRIGESSPRVQIHRGPAVCKDAPDYESRLLGQLRTAHSFELLTLEHGARDLTPQSKPKRNGLSRVSFSFTRPRELRARSKNRDHDAASKPSADKFRSAGESSRSRVTNVYAWAISGSPNRRCDTAFRCTQSFSWFVRIPVLLPPPSDRGLPVLILPTDFPLRGRVLKCETVAQPCTTKGWRTTGNSPAFITRTHSYRKYQMP